MAASENFEDCGLLESRHSPREGAPGLNRVTYSSAAPTEQKEKGGQRLRHPRKWVPQQFSSPAGRKLYARRHRVRVCEWWP